MSMFERTIVAFIQIIENQPALLSQSDWSDLQKIASNLPENIDEISQIIRDWLKQEGRNCIETAFEEYRDNMRSEFALFNNNKTLGPGRSQSPTPVNQPSLSSKELLENAIKRNSPLSNVTKTAQDINITQKP